ncbi:MAG: HemK/PrmC family methyltransferase [Nitrospirota bacterium]
MKVIEKLRETTKFLKRNGIESAEKEAEMLVKHGLGISAAKIYSDNPELSEEQTVTLGNMLRRRLRREPVQYILGYEEFLGLKLLVGPGVLIPRPETELMAEQAMKAVNSNKLQVTSKNKSSSLVPRPSSLSILDLCTGSGCLALALAKEFHDCQVYGTDISETAIEYAKKNAEINKINNVTFIHGNLFEPFNYKNPLYEPLAPSHRPPSLPTRLAAKRAGQAGPFVKGGKFNIPSLVKRGKGRFLENDQLFDLIISNPPYVRTGDIKNLQPEIKDWEPVVALDGGADGLGFYRELIPAARGFLKDSGIIMLEVGFGQSGRVADIIKSSGYELLEIIKDYAGIERIIKAKWKR